MSQIVHKLTQELINQIAAGEVVERPASVVKELIDNSIDAGANEIKVKIEQGGLKSIEVSDNGKGIDQKDLPLVFDSHTTSKISSLEDLNNILTMGFRGEALSTIQSVSQASIVSKSKNSTNGYSIDFESSNKVVKSARNDGTTLTIKNLFYNTPARLKFMKTPETEYRKIVELFNTYALAFTNIQFILEKDGKQVINLPKNDTLKTRLKTLLKKDFVDRMIDIQSDGAGIKISGLVAHPSDTVARTKDQYIYINKRPIWDSGVAKSIQLGFSRFIPHQNKVPFIIFIETSPSNVDVNVHPRKEEVKFINPYRIYSTVENCVSQTLSNSLNSLNIHTQQPNILFDRAQIQYSKSTGGISQLKFDRKPSEFNIHKSIEFSKEILTPFNQEEDSEFRNIFQIFNKYIVIEFENDVWIIDQHAAAERISFEKLLNNYSTSKPEIQNLLVSEDIEANEEEVSYVNENIKFFNKLGFELSVKDGIISISSIPAHLVGVNITQVFKSIWELPDNQRDLEKDFEKAKEDILATIACHGSIRSGQSLSNSECLNIYKELLKCKNPYSCPHGRPAVWKLKLSEIDSHFLRTY